MRKIRTTVLLAATFAAFAVTAAPALAHEFVAKPGSGTTQDKNVGTHVFETGVGTVECKQLKSKGTVIAEKSATQKETVEYSNCKAFGDNATVSQAKYNFSAEGTVSLENEVVIKVPVGTCEVKVPSAGNQNLSKVEYKNLPNNTIEVVATAEGITSTGSGGVCGTGTKTTGKYKGIAVVELAGGELKFV